MGVELIHEGEYANLYVDGEMVVSVSPDHDEVCVYGEGEEPAFVGDLP